MKKVYILAAFMAIVVGIAAYLFASSLKQDAKTTKADISNVVVATMEIPANTLISADMVQLATLPSEAVSPYALSDLGKVIGTINKSDLLPGEQVLSPRLLQQGQEEGGLSYTLEDGQRAITVGVDEVSGVSGYIAKGDYVDIIATVILKDASGQNQTISTSMVENLLVLEVGTKPTGTETTTPNYTTVTLSATPEEALKINYAATNGKLRLLLRPILDDENVNPADYPS